MIMKAVTLYRPGILENVVSDFDRYLNSFFGDNFLTPSERLFDGNFGFRGNNGLQRLPSVDVRETEKAYFLEAELPGLEEKDIEVRLDNNTLTIESKKEEERKIPEQTSACACEESATSTGTDRNYLIRERRFSSFSRSFRLPENADPEGISASFKNGILSLEINKKAEAQKRVIQISKK